MRELVVPLDKGNADSGNKIGSEVALKAISAHTQELILVSRPLAHRLNLTATAATPKKAYFLFRPVFFR